MRQRCSFAAPQFVGQQPHTFARAHLSVGRSSSGKSHLLKAVAHALREQGVHVGWLDASILTPPAFDESWAAVLMDDVHLYTAQQQHAAFNWFVNAMTPSTGQQRWVLAAGATPTS